MWDLRKNEPIIQVNDSSSKVRCSGIAWHPDVATQMVTASSDDRAPVIQVPPGSLSFSAYDKKSNFPGYFKHFIPYWRLSLYLACPSTIRMGEHFHQKMPGVRLLS